ncbi:uncharacterized protein [Haliotis cracherodii]|uniref:uncharacterized protein n=1 Tax=Haliotis cracherodii TaxID=6455 RepID=UPI0039ED3FDB
MTSTTEDGAFPVHVPADKLTLYLAKKGARVLRVTFHDTSSWCHEITWTCKLIPDKYCPYINHHKFRQQLPVLKEQFATHGRLTSIQIDQWMFVFGHDTEDTAWEMTTGYEHIKDIILKFLHEIHAQVTDIEMESVIRKVDAAAARKDQGPDNRTVNSTIIINLPSGKAVCESCWKAEHENIPQPTDIDIESVKILLNELFPDSLVRVRWECMVFCFEHESMEDAMGMIVQHADIKQDILHFLQELDPSIEDIVMEVEVRELSEFVEQTAQTSGNIGSSS